jgi:hypothetical protein
MYTVYGDPIESFGTHQSIRFKPTEKNFVVSGAFTWLIVNNVSTWTNLRLHIYSDRNSRPGAIIVSSTTSYDHAHVMQDFNSGVKYLGFSFSSITSLNKNTYYHLVLSADDYTYSDNSCLAWLKAWPDPIYNQPATFNSFAGSSYMFGIVGAEL